jgi:hypothetical protein
MGRLQTTRLHHAQIGGIGVRWRGRAATRSTSYQRFGTESTEQKDRSMAHQKRRRVRAVASSWRTIVPKPSLWADVNAKLDSLRATCDGYQVESWYKRLAVQLCTVTGDSLPSNFGKCSSAYNRKSMHCIQSAQTHMLFPPTWDYSCGELGCDAHVGARPCLLFEQRLPCSETHTR